MLDLSVIYYTSNYLEKKNPYFLKNCWNQLLKASEGFPIIAVSQKPMSPEFYGSGFTNKVMEGFERSHLNIYRQILEGAKLAKTKFVAMAEDDILYSREHFHPEFSTRMRNITEDTFYFDMSKVSIFTWYKPPIFSFRTKRRVVNQLIAPRQMLIDYLEERFRIWPEFVDKMGKITPEHKDDPDHFLKYWGDPGRYDSILGMKKPRIYEYYSWIPSVVFSHEYAYGYETNQGKKKKHGDIRIVELVDWGKASDILKLYKNE